LLIACGTFILLLLLYYWEQSVREKEQTNPFTSQLPLYPSSDKEAKVTSLDPSLGFSALSQNEFLDLNSSHKKELGVLHTTLKEDQDQYERLVQALESKTLELEQQQQDNQLLQLKVEQVTQDFADYKLFSEEQLKQKQIQLSSLQQMLEEQRSEMEKRQEQIQQLDGKVHDLSYEIKTLLYLHEDEISSSKSSTSAKAEVSAAPLPVFSSPSSVIETLERPLALAEDHPDVQHDKIESPVHTSIEAAKLLKHCIQVAEKLTGANYHHNESSRYREFRSSYYAIDQRRLFDSFRHETYALIVVYSQKEQKIVFANNEAKTILGWSPEKLIADFSALIQGGMQEWKRAINLLATANESQARFLAKARNGQEILLNCHLGVIPTGLFRNYVIGVFYDQL
jgi:PAS domain-containing protein